MTAHLVISEFTGQHKWLSNFHDQHPFHWDGLIRSPDGKVMQVAPAGVYATGEHAYQTAKTADPAEQDTIRAADTPGRAKKAGQARSKGGHVTTLRAGWDEGMSVAVMVAVTAAKYTTPDLTRQLVGTGDALLVEGNTWGDHLWGDTQPGVYVEPQPRPAGRVNQPGLNRLGQILMRERARLRGDAPNTWIRVALTGHRDLPADQHAWTVTELERVATRLRDEHGTVIGISGLAVGADTWWADTIVNTGLRLWAYSPGPWQDDKWGANDKAVRERFLDAAELTFHGWGPDYHVSHLHARNRAMVRDADVLIAVHDPSKSRGGTAATVQHAITVGCPLVRVNPASRHTTIRPGHPRP